jgi:carbon-monoxide dehydrogenase large subunit
MATSPVLPKLVGTRVKRREDPRLIQGKGTYVDDVKIVGMQYVAFKRSDVAHGRILSIDTKAAEAMEGVEAVFTGKQIAEFVGPMPIGTPFPSPEHRVVATDVVRFGGEAVAVVVATDRYVARDAVDAITVQYEVLPAVVDPEAALAGKPTVIHEKFANNVAIGPDPRRHRRGARRLEGGRQRHRRGVQERRDRHLAAHDEPAPGAERDGAARRGGALRSGQGHDDHLVVDAEPAHPAHVHRDDERHGRERGARDRPEVGGGFGAKINIYAEEYVVAGLSKKLEMPLKWIEDRSEAFVATIHGRDILGYVDLAAKRDGTVLGLKLRLIADIGAYNMLLTAAIPTLTMLMANATYAFPAIRVTLTEVFTNKTPTDAYRGAGRPEATYFVERAMDMLAKELKMDPAEVRRKNFIPKDQFPFQTHMGAVYDSGDYEKALDKALETVQLGAAQEGSRQGEGRRASRRHRPLDVCRGVRHRPVGVAPDRRLGARAGDDRARRPHHRDDRRVAARPGQRDHLSADARRSVQRAVRARHHPARRHRRREAGHRHLRQPLAGRRAAPRSTWRAARSRRRWPSSPRRCSKRTKTTSCSRAAASR